MSVSVGFHQVARIEPRYTFVNGHTWIELLLFDGRGDRIGDVTCFFSKESEGRETARSLGVDLPIKLEGVQS